MKPTVSTAEEQHHRPEAEQADVAQGHRPRKQEGDLEVEDDEQDGDEIETHVELAAGVVERREAALERRQLLGVRVLAGDQVGAAEHGANQGEREAEEDQDRKVFLQKSFHRHPFAPFGLPALGLARATGLEPATSGVTGRRSNQLNYARIKPQTARGEIKDTL